MTIYSKRLVEAIEDWFKIHTEITRVEYNYIKKIVFEGVTK